MNIFLQLMCKSGLHGPTLRELDQGRPAGHEKRNAPSGGVMLEYVEARAPRWVERCKWCECEIITNDTKEPSA